MGSQDLGWNVVVFSTAVIVLTGCTWQDDPTGAADVRTIGDSYPASSTAPLTIGEPWDTNPNVEWVERGQRFYITTYGSSSCPLAPISLDDATNGLMVEMAPIGGPACTADLGLSSYALDVPESKRGSTNFTVTLKFQEGEQAELLLK
ncbi:hypothetical protein [Arthrobacter sp. TMS2-4]